MSDVVASTRDPQSPALVGRLSASGALALRRVTSRDDWKRVRELRFESFARRGEVASSEERSYSDAHDGALNAVTVMLTSGERLVGTTRSSASSARRRWPLPADDVFAPEIERTVGLDATVVEASLMAVDAAAVEEKLALIHLFKAHMLHAAAEDADWLIAAVRDSQIGFFRRMFNMEILSGAERVPGLATPRVLMGLRYREKAQLLAKRIPLLAGGEADERLFAQDD